ncbi:hypothetical protein [Parasitella parasitica]|uniref:Tc1-like transposase DDE domain-containing protein n=1 Tax=Parasitella parasitica TaxID=35722 RepID=A0A0B7N9X7_9FUNG|nr:hypothetical protein [Parasitella parasitica]
MDFIHYQPSAENYMSEDSDDDMGLETTAIEFGRVEMLVDFDGMKQIQEVEMEEVVDNLAEEMSLVSLKTSKRYKKYGQDQIDRFIRVRQEEGLSVPIAAKLCGIPRSTAYELMNEFNAGPGTVLPGNKPRKTNNKSKKLFPEHSSFLIALFDQNPSIVLEEAKIKLCEAFPGLEISITGLYMHIREKCALTLKQATKYTAERDSPRTLQLRFDIITQWKAAGVDFQKNCVFVDEAGFHTQMIRGRAWSKKGNPAVVKVHTQKGVNMSIVGCIASFGIINFSKVEPLKKSDAALIEKEFGSQTNKKRKANGQDVGKAKKLAKGTTAYHIVRFMESCMDVSDKTDKKGMFIVLDNCRIHHSAFVVDAINKRGYKPLFMPPYSPFLNSIEECWSKMKKHIRRNPLDKADTLTPRIAESISKVTIDDCKGWVRQAETFWDRCLNKELRLK